jgi:hypothetical protein
MPYTEQNLKGFTLEHLKTILYKVQAHKSALPDEEVNKGYNKDTYENRREKLARDAGRMDLIYDKEAYKKFRKRADQQNYLIQQIIAVEKSPFIGKYIDADKNLKFDYIRDVDEKGGIINPYTGHVKYPKKKKTKKEESGGMETKTAPATAAATEPTEAAPSTEPTEKPYPELPTTKTEEIKKEAGKIMVENYRKKRKQLFDEDADHFDKMNHLVATSKSDGYGIEDITEAQEEMLSAIRRMNHNVNRQDKDQVNQLKGMLRIFGETITARITNDQYSPQEASEMKGALEGLKKYELKHYATRGEKSVFQESLQKIIDKEEYKPHERIYEDTNIPRLPSEQEQNAPLMQKSGDKAIGDVRSIGFLGPMDALAKADDVIIPESERSKSIRRFTNFRWVDSIQNSKLGYDSPFQRMEDIDNRRRYGKCFMPTNKLPKDPDTQEELNKTKGFNTYPLVPSYNLSGLMQPATEFSYKQSTDPHARKINIDEKQFANKKLYNFEETDKRIRPTNPFASSFGMESIEQSHRNPNNVKNTLEFSSVMVDDDPFKRIKNKYKTNVVA